MSIRNKILMSLGAMVVCGSAILAIESPASAAGSTFQRSCKNIGISGNVLKATCRTYNGRWRRSSLTLRGIHNNNGRLVRGRGIASFHRSCAKIRISGTILSARCRTRRGGYAGRTSIYVDNVANRNGSLVYE